MQGRCSTAPLESCVLPRGVRYVMTGCVVPVAPQLSKRCCAWVCRALPVWLAMAGLHVALGLALKLYFFHYSSTA